MNSLNLNARTIFTLVIVAIVLIAGGFLLAGFTPLIFPVQASAESQQIDELFRIMLVIGGAIFLLVQGLLVFSVWRFRAKPGDNSDGIHMHGNTTLEIIWTVIPAVIVLVLTILSWQVFSSIQAPKDDEMLVRSVGARFNWAFNYAAPLSVISQTVDVSTLPQAVQDDLADDEMITVSAPELHTYVGRPVVIEMEPRDVIHSFWVPAFRVKQDLIPGRITTVRFTPTVAGTYPIKCAELCGANHGAMISQVIVHEDEAAYNAWLAPEVEGVIFPSADPVERGRDILASNIYPCYTCHVLTDLAAFNWNGNVGPALNGIADRAATSRAAATGQLPADYLYQSIDDPHAYLAPGYGALMPDLGIGDCDIRAMVAYLGTQTAAGNPVVIDTEAYAAECAGAAPETDFTEATAEATADAEATVDPEATLEAGGPLAEATVGAQSGLEITEEPLNTDTPTLEVTAAETAIPTVIATPLPPTAGA